MARSAKTRAKDHKRRNSRKNRQQFLPGSSSPTKLTTSARLGLPSVSDRLMELIAPYDNQVQSHVAFERLITLAAMSWNVANTPDEKRGAMMSDLLVTAFPDLKDAIRALSSPTDPGHAAELVTNLDPQLRQSASDFLKIVTGLMLRKIKLFPGDCRMIVKWFFEDLPEQRILRVASFFSPDQKPY